MPTYARLLHDIHRPDKDYQSRTASPEWPKAWNPTTPQTQAFFRRPAGGKDEVPLNENWMAYLAALNSERSAKFIFSPPSGLFNRGRENGADSLSFGGNVVKIEAIKNRSAQIKAFNFRDRPPDPTKVNFYTMPWLVQKFTAVDIEGRVVNPAEGIDVYTFIIGKEQLYVPLDRIEMFPELPMLVQIKASLRSGLTARRSPDLRSHRQVAFAPLTRVQISEYALHATHVWGRTNKGWIVLCWYPGGFQRYYGSFPHYFTSWEMKTVPPVPPATDPQGSFSLPLPADETQSNPRLVFHTHNASRRASLFLESNGDYADTAGGYIVEGDEVAFVDQLPAGFRPRGFKRAVSAGEAWKLRIVKRGLLASTDPRHAAAIAHQPALEGWLLNKDGHQILAV